MHPQCNHALDICRKDGIYYQAARFGGKFLIFFCYWVSGMRTFANMDRTNFLELQVLPAVIRKKTALSAKKCDLA